MFILFVRVDIYYYFLLVVKFLEIELKWTNKLNWIELSKEVCCNSNVSLTRSGGGAPSRRRPLKSGGEAPAAGQFFEVFWKQKLF